MIVCFTKAFVKEIHLPLWAVIYAIILFINSIGTIIISQSKSPLYILGQLLSGIFAITFFLFYYNLLPRPNNIITPLLMLGFILFQEIWINRELYNLLSLNNIPKEEHKFMLLFIPLVTILLISPFVWIVLQVFKSYFSNI